MGRPDLPRYHGSAVSTVTRASVRQLPVLWRPIPALPLPSAQADCVSMLASKLMPRRQWPGPRQSLDTGLMLPMTLRWNDPGI
jgi:hypothetical protein